MLDSWVSLLSIYCMPQCILFNAINMHAERVKVIAAEIFWPEVICFLFIASCALGTMNASCVRACIASSSLSAKHKVNLLLCHSTGTQYKSANSFCVRSMVFRDALLLSLFLAPGSVRFPAPRSFRSLSSCTHFGGARASLCTSF